MGNNNDNLYISRAGTPARVLNISAQKGCLLLYFLNRFSSPERGTWHAQAVITAFPLLALQSGQGIVRTMFVWYHQACFYHCIAAMWTLGVNGSVCQNWAVG